MVRRYYNLPSLTALAIFEASARHLSFKLAAEEMNITPSAVSRQIKAIENDIGLRLFVRTGTGVELSPLGDELYAVLANGFSRASEAVQMIRRGDTYRHVTLACSDAFASMWLVPKMPSFWERYPDVVVDHLISDNVRDYRRAEVDLRVRYGHGSWPDEESELLFGDVIYPVCSPRFAELHPDVTAETIHQLPLLHLDWVDSDWPGWDDVLRRGKVPAGGTRGKRFGKFSVALQAAQAHQGVVLGWHKLIHSLVNDGRLVKLTNLALTAPGSYFLTWNSNRELSAAATNVRDWLRALARQERKRP